MTDKKLVTEREELFEPNVYIEIVVDIEGETDADKLCEAVGKAFTLNETTMSHIIINSDSTAEYIRQEVSGCRVSVSDKDWRELVLENEKKPFAIDMGEMMRVFVIKKDKGLQLLVMAHHLVGDGKSITYFIEDVMKCLSGEKTEFKNMKNYSVDMFPKASKMLPLIKHKIKSINKKWDKVGREFLIEDYYKIHNVYWKNRNSVILSEKFTKEELTKLHAKCRKLKISINSIITAAFLKADTGNNVVGMAISVRNNDTHVMGNQVSGIRVKMNYKDTKSIEKNASVFQRKANKMLNRPKIKYFILWAKSIISPSFVDSSLMNAYGLYENSMSDSLAKIMEYKNRKLKDLSMTNLTKLDIASVYGPYTLKNFIFVPPAISYADHVIGAASMDDGMEITYHFMNNKDKRREKEFFEKAVCNLRNVIAS